ncbi:hypothetical protein FRB99_002076 [Tulasnella sp. 403]|nr:hypothetical protein FRB99_002076 [Tulasnella sp. 403]
MEYKEVEVKEKEPSVKAKEEELVWGEGPEPTFKECITAEQNGEPIGWGETQPLWELTKEVKEEEEILIVKEEFTCIEEDFKVLEEQLEAIRLLARWIFCKKTINLQNYEERYREVYPADKKSPFFTPFTIKGPLMMHGFYASYLMQIERIMEEYIKTRHQAQFQFEVVKEANPMEVSA